MTASLPPRLGKIAYTVDEACDATGVSRSTLYKEHRAGRLEMGQVCGRTVIRATELERWWESQYRAFTRAA